ncbi:MAG: DegV family protein [Lachnospiraceae bacterium]|jgi:DegV family protein with EDD domain|nr:DegV family protein [Lachnospiraceae bacterium]
MEYQVISDSSCDLEADLKEKYNIEVVPFFVSFEEEKYYKEIEEIAIRDVYDKMVSNPKKYPKTSLPSVQNYVDAFMPHIRAGRGVICVCITTSLSGSYNSAVNARDIICEDYPDAKIAVINSYGATVYQRLYVIEAAKMQQQGYSYEENVKILQGQMRDTARIFFTVGDLDYLQHGGRIGKLAGLAGSVLNLKPLITLEGGSIDSSGIARSRKKSMAKTIELLKSYFKENKENPVDYEYAVGYGYDMQEGIQYKKQVDEALKEMGVEKGADLVQIGATICVHTGPYAIGVGLVKRFGCCTD